jgi:hypothetical protein
MLRKDKPETLIQLLATYRSASFPKSKTTQARLASLARTIAHNCAATIAFADCRLKKITKDSEEMFSVHEVREEALRLKKECAKVGRNGGSEGRRKEVESLRMQYDNFSGSVRHMVGLFDPSLQEALDEIL